MKKEYEMRPWLKNYIHSLLQGKRNRYDFIYEITKDNNLPLHPSIIDVHLNYIKENYVGTLITERMFIKKILEPCEKIKQKYKEEPLYKKGSLVYINTEDKHYNGHFAIVEGTYAELCGSKSGDFYDYSLFILNDEFEVINNVSWYEEGELIFIDNEFKNIKYL